MPVFLSLCISALLIVGAVFGLRHYHQRAFTRAAQREDTLPPLREVKLDLDKLAELGPESTESDPQRVGADHEDDYSTPTQPLIYRVMADEYISSQRTEVDPATEDNVISSSTHPVPEPAQEQQTALSADGAPSAPADIATAPDSKVGGTNESFAKADFLETDAPQTDCVTTPSSLASASPSQPAKPRASSGDWRQRALALRQSADYEAALACCGEAWPQWQSYQQAAIVMRAAIKNADTNQERADWYDRLYQLAIQASVLHDKVDGLPNLSRQQIVDRFSRDDLEALGRPWKDVGYEQLRLLTKSDRQQLTALYGIPNAHRSAKTWFADRL